MSKSSRAKLPLSCGFCTSGSPARAYRSTPWWLGINVKREPKGAAQVREAGAYWRLGLISCSAMRPRGPEINGVTPNEPEENTADVRIGCRELRMCDVAQNGVGCTAAAGRVSRAVGDSWDFAGGDSASVNEQYEASATAPDGGEQQRRWIRWRQNRQRTSLVAPEGCELNSGAAVQLRRAADCFLRRRANRALDTNEADGSLKAGAARAEAVRNPWFYATGWENR